MTFERWADLGRHGVSTIYEASGREGLVQIPLIQVVAGTQVAGPARTVRCGQGDNLMVHAVMDQVVDGEVLVFVMPEPRPEALLGEILAIQAQRRGAAALLLDAAIRDADEIRKMKLPTWTRWISPKGPDKKVWGAVNEPVVVGGVTIEAGDGVVLDADGVVIVRQSRLDDVLDLSTARTAKEDDLRKKLRDGALTYDLFDLRDVAERLRHPHV